ncbi:MAG: hypothetical protein Q9157_004000 [Trypethelium eluteriae]
MDIGTTPTEILWSTAKPRITGRDGRLKLTSLWKVLQLPRTGGKGQKHGSKTGQFSHHTYLCKKLQQREFTGYSDSPGGRLLELDLPILVGQIFKNRLSHVQIAVCLGYSDPDRFDFMLHPWHYFKSPLHQDDTRRSSGSLGRPPVDLDSHPNEAPNVTLAKEAGSRRSLEDCLQANEIRIFNLISQDTRQTIQTRSEKVDCIQDINGAQKTPGSLFMKALAEWRLAQEYDEWEKKTHNSSRIDELVKDPRKSKETATGHVYDYVRTLPISADSYELVREAIRHGIRLLVAEEMLKNSHELDSPGIMICSAFAHTQFTRLDYVNLQSKITTLTKTKVWSLLKKAVPWVQSARALYKNRGLPNEFHMTTNTDGGVEDGCMRGLDQDQMILRMTPSVANCHGKLPGPAPVTLLPHYKTADALYS